MPFSVIPKPDDRLLSRNRGRGEGSCTPSLPRSPRPLPSPPLSLASPAERSALLRAPAPESRSPAPQLPAALTLGPRPRWRRWSSRSPSRRRPGSPARELAAADPGGGDEGGGREAPRAGGRQGTYGSEGLSGTTSSMAAPGAQSRALQAWAGRERKLQGNPRPRRARLWDPAGPTRHLGNHGAGNPQPPERGSPAGQFVVVKRAGV